MRTKASWPANRCAYQAPERRRKARRPAEGEVVLLLGYPEPVEIRGRLVDMSAEGFRAIHQHCWLCTGQEVMFQHPLGEGVAQVVWNRVLGDCVESGFLILEKKSPER